MPTTSTAINIFLNQPVQQPSLRSVPISPDYSSKLAAQLFEITTELFKQNQSKVSQSQWVDTTCDFYFLKADLLEFRQQISNDPETLIKIRAYRVDSILDNTGKRSADVNTDQELGFIVGLTIVRAGLTLNLNASFCCDAFNSLGERLGFTNTAELKLLTELLEILNSSSTGEK